MITAITNNFKPTFRQLAFHNSSLNIKVDTGENLKNRLHYHPQIELIWLKRSEGTRIIGTSVEVFKHNDVFLIGKNTPHSFHHEEKFLLSSFQQPEAVVIQFCETFMGKEFLELPEVKEIRSLFTIAKQGACVTEEGKKNIIPLIEKMLHVSSLDRILLLLQILSIMANENSYHLLASDGLASRLKVTADGRIDKIMNFTSENYDKNIKIEQVAEIINLTKESFCRYFKSQTNKSYVEFLIEFRITKACQLIQKDQMSIKEIAYSCGFDSLSNFHYQFKKIMNQSPCEFKQSYFSTKLKLAV